MRVTLVVWVGLTSLLLAPAAGLAQFPPGGDMRSRFGGGSGFSGFGGRSSMSSDPLERWNQRTGGRDVWVRAEITDPMQQRIFDMIAQQIGATNGVITRDQYLNFSQQRMSSGGSRFGGGPPGSGGPSGFFGSRGSFPPPGGPSSAPGMPPPPIGMALATPPSGPSFDGRGGGGFNPDMFAEGMFRRQDQNGDGLLNYDEMPESLRIERDKWDANRDGFVDLAEYKSYFQARAQQWMQERGGGGWGGGPGGTTPDDEEQKPVVYRAGKLPKDIPSWFRDLDKDEDGQIGLYEWRAGTRPLDDFRGMDRNGDGFLVVEEVMRSATQANGTSGDSRGGDSRRDFSPGAPGGPAMASSSEGGMRFFMGPGGGRPDFGGGRPDFGSGRPDFSRFSGMSRGDFGSRGDSNGSSRYGSRGDSNGSSRDRDRDKGGDRRSSDRGSERGGGDSPWGRRPPGR